MRVCSSTGLMRPRSAVFLILFGDARLLFVALVEVEAIAESDALAGRECEIRPSLSACFQNDECRMDWPRKVHNPAHATRSDAVDYPDDRRWRCRQFFHPQARNNRTNPPACPRSLRPARPRTGQYVPRPACPDALNASTRRASPPSCHPCHRRKQPACPAALGA